MRATAVKVSGNTEAAVAQWSCQPARSCRPARTDRTGKRIGTNSSTANQDASNLRLSMDAELFNIVIQVTKATGLPTSTLYGKPSTYVAIEYNSASGVAIGRTSVIENDTNPELGEHIVLKEKISTAPNLIVDKEIKITMMSNEGISATAMGVPIVLKLKDELAAKPGQEITLLIKDSTGQPIARITIKLFGGY